MELAKIQGYIEDVINPALIEFDKDIQGTSLRPRLCQGNAQGHRCASGPHHRPHHCLLLMGAESHEFQSRFL